MNMEARKNYLSRSGEYSALQSSVVTTSLFGRFSGMVRSKLVAGAVAVMLSVPTLSHAQQLRVNVSGAPFTRALIEKLAVEYKKTEPGVDIAVVSEKNADGQVKVSDNDFQAIGRFVVLPIANSQNNILNIKKVQRGLNGRLERQLFVERDYLETLDAQEEGEKALPATVYSLTGSRALTTNLFAKRLNVSPSQIKGKKIVGREENVITAVKLHNDAVGVSVPSLIYNVSDGTVVNGISVLNVDLDGNGRFSDAERDALQNLGSLTDYLDRQPAETLPTGSIAIESSDSRLQKFADWARTEGQAFLHGQGYLKTTAALTAQR